MMVMVVMRVMMFEMDEMMASEGPPDRSTRLDSREALSAPTLAIPRNTTQYHTRNTTDEDTVAQFEHMQYLYLQYPNKAAQYEHLQYPRLHYHSRGYGGTTCNTNTYNTNTCNTTLTIPRSTYLISLIFVCQRCMVGILFD